MSIKKLFDLTEKTRNYLADTTEKNAFESAESGRNVEEIRETQETFVPQIDYTKPENFARYGSAYLYYKSAVERIINFYPYDGSDAEINAFYNGSLDIEKYLFNNLYPRTNGYINISAGGWGSRSGDKIDGWGLPATLEDITFYGGPNTITTATTAKLFIDPKSSNPASANIYDTDIYTDAGLPTTYGSGSRESNLQCDFDNGIGTEFWLLTGSINTATQTVKQCVVDIWNNELSSSADYGRVTVSLHAQAPASPFRLTVQSGTTGIFEQAIGNNLTVADLANFKHYAITAQNSGSAFVTKLYVDGVLNDTNTVTSTTLNEINPKNMMGRVGALLTAPSGSAPAASLVGAGKLTGSIDEFRFWKIARNAQNVGRHWFTQVRGGTNTDISNTTLGVYYKFNEGITGIAATDSTVLDYSGRVSNGTWTGYTTGSRTTLSAIVEASAAASEYKDPIIYSTNPHVATVKADLLNSGSYHDAQNNASIVNMIPAWILEEDEENKTDNTHVLSHILGAYFDKIYLWIAALPQIKTAGYPSASATPIPFAEHLPQSLGLYTPELFVDSSLMEKFLSRNDTELFQSNLNEAKNIIYTNLYNNLAHIYKSKGTERAIRNTLRCLGVDDGIIRTNIYSNNDTFFLEDKLQQTINNKKSLNFNDGDNKIGVVYQYAEPGNGDSSGYISGSHGAYNSFENSYGFTVETDILFPRFSQQEDKVGRTFKNVSLFGLHTVDTAAPTDTVWLGADVANFQVWAVRPNEYDKNVYFKITSSNSPFPFPQLTSSTFFNVYDNNKWNFSVRLKPSNYPLYNIVTGSTTSDATYDLIFRGVNSVAGVIAKKFELTASIDTTVAQNFLTSSKRVYVGARRTNITGGIIDPSDVLTTGARYWMKTLQNSDLDQHVYDVNNAGISASYQGLSPINVASFNTEVLNHNALILNWNFDNVTGSDSSGDFYVTDVSSGSVLLRENYGWADNLVGYQHTGRGSNFPVSSTDVVQRRSITSYKLINPEVIVASDMINILNEEEKIYGIQETPPNYHYMIEKSMYAAISDEMLTFFAGIVDFNNVIGAPVNRYRARYKTLEKLRAAFFRRVTKTSDVEKFLDYYKWFDDAITMILSQLMPASMTHAGDLLNVIEPHVLERDKYQTKFPTIEFRPPDPEAPALGINTLLYTWKFNHHPTSSIQAKNSPWWRERAKRLGSAVISSGDANVDEDRDSIRAAIANGNNITSSTVSTVGKVKYQTSTYIRRKLAKTYKLDIGQERIIKGGVNFTPDKSIQYTYTAIAPAGPIDTNNRFLPQNVLFGNTDDLVLLPDTDDVTEPNKKVKRIIKVQHGRDWEGGLGYKNVKSSLAFPFNIMSTSVDSGYTAQVISRVTANVDIVNLHNDVYGPDMEVPMQGPFTDYAVGGHQSRHIALNKSSSRSPASQGLDTWLTRPEAWKLLLGRCTMTSGALGMVGADYPWPEANDPDFAPYPMTASQKAVYYRGFVAKRPVNIRNIHYTTGSTVLGNYQKTYEYVNVVGSWSNPRSFVKEQPSLPSQIFQDTALAATQTRTFLDIHRSSGSSQGDAIGYAWDFGLTSSHFGFVDEFSIGYLTAATNDTIINSRFSAPGGIETLGVGYRDFRGSEYSAYNALPFRNLSVLRPGQPPGGPPTGSSGSIPLPVPLQGTPGIRNYDIHGKDYGLRPLLARHSARFGRDSVFVGDPGASYVQLPSFQKTNRNPKHIIRISDANATFGDGSPLLSASLYDNFFVSYQIPRADRQYAWITGAIGAATDSRYYSFAPLHGFMAGRYSSSAGVSSYFDFVTASNRIVKAGTADLEQPTNRLNILTIDPVSSSTNTIGSDPANTGAYINSELVPLPLRVGPDYLNLLLTRRAATYDYTWAHLYEQENPILRKEYLSNSLSIFDGSSLSSYILRPVSTRGRTTLLNITVAANAQNYTLKVSNNNEKIFFNTAQLNNATTVTTEGLITSYDQLIDIVTQGKKDIGPTGVPPYSLNWVVYSEMLYPSLRNEYASGTITRTGFDNKYWRALDSERVTLGTTLPNSFNVETANGGEHIAQSSWVLDAQSDFLTRTVPPSANSQSLWPDGQANNADGLVLSGAAGELQNNYFSYYSGSGKGVNFPLAFRAPRYMKPSGLYARKHMISNPHSVVSPAGMFIPQTGSAPATDGRVVEPGFKLSEQIEIYAGEAKWVANAQAGRVTDVDGTTTFQSHSSEPWFNEYADFHHDLKLVAKDFSIIPEFRISEHIEEYMKYGAYSDSLTNTFEIPGTTLSSSQKSFYTDYSNSEFMNEFLNIDADTALTAKEIKLVCSAAIRLSPYKGFYPAQRTLDLVSQFSRSYAQNLIGWATGSAREYGAGKSPAGEHTFVSYDFPLMRNQVGGALRPTLQPICAPGILYNSIKAGLAVDYPIVDSGIISASYAGTEMATDNYALWADGKLIDSNPFSTKYNGGEFWGTRLPFETLLNPPKYLAGKIFYDTEPHPSASLVVTGAWQGTSIDLVYPLMAENFFGAVGDFFLKDQTYTQLKSGVITSGLSFESGSVYGARIKLRKTSDGERSYEWESSSFGNNAGYTPFGASRLLTGGVDPALFNGVEYEGTYPLPQDPRQNPHFQENFTMYSRPTAFGPPCSGRSPFSGALGMDTLNAVPVDSFNGYNWSFTPPYYDGEAWVDLIFRPLPSTSYTLEGILSSIETVYWRADPGVIITGSDDLEIRTGPSTTGRPFGGTTLLRSTSQTGLLYRSSHQTASVNAFWKFIYGGDNVNANAMQLSASINLFGIEEVLQQEIDKFENEIKAINTSVGQRWVIQPKFETPMLNFNDTGIHPITGSLLALPTYGAASVPRGMWHQFGVIPEDPNKGVFLSIGDIPSEWLQYHYDVRDNNSVYNNNDAGAYGATIHRQMKSLTDLMDFATTDNIPKTSLSKGVASSGGAEVRLGELAEEQIIKEAIVAIPYITEAVPPSQSDKMSNTAISTVKKFIDIPLERWIAALPEGIGSATNDSLDAAGASIRNLVAKMQNYVLPPQFDFVSNTDITPIVMYMFEFEYKLDKDDLSYIWQNLAPRNYQKMTMEYQSVAHELMDTELLNNSDLINNTNLRWMVFKVKQKAQSDYFNKIVTQVGSSTNDIFDLDLSANGYNLAFNWPYDYVSFVELVKMEAEVLYGEPRMTAEDVAEFIETGEEISEGEKSFGMTGGPGTGQRS